MQTLYLMCGISFAGKSTLAREMVKQTDMTMVDHDEIYSKIMDKIPIKLGEEESTELWISVKPKVQLAAEKVLKEGKSLIVDTTSSRKSTRLEYAELAAGYDARTIVIFVNISKETARNRILDNRKSGARHDVPDFAFFKAIERLQPPGDDEDFLVFNETDSEEEWVKAHIAKD